MSALKKLLGAQSARQQRLEMIQESLTPPPTQTPISIEMPAMPEMPVIPAAPAPIVIEKPAPIMEPKPVAVAPDADITKVDARRKAAAAAAARRGRSSTILSRFGLGSSADAATGDYGGKKLG
jgi:hypothetical protein